LLRQEERRKYDAGLEWSRRAPGAKRFDERGIAGEMRQKS
jgi:hypothetical protein